VAIRYASSFAADACPASHPLAAAANPHGEAADARAEAASKAGAAQR